MRRHRSDNNHTGIIKRLRSYPGITVKSVSQVDEFCDIVVGFQNRNYLIEIKDPDKPPSKRKLTPGEQKFHNLWTGQISVALTVDEILELIEYPLQTITLKK